MPGWQRFLNGLPQRSRARWALATWHLLCLRLSLFRPREGVGQAAWQSEAGGGGNQARQGAAADLAEARRSVAPRHCRGTRPPRHQELERQALERRLGQECDDTPRPQENGGRVMTPSPAAPTAA